MVAKMSPIRPEPPVQTTNYEPQSLPPLYSTTLPESGSPKNLKEILALNDALWKERLTLTSATTAEQLGSGSYCDTGLRQANQPDLGTGDFAEQPSDQQEFSPEMRRYRERERFDRYRREKAYQRLGSDVLKRKEDDTYGSTPRQDLVKDARRRYLDVNLGLKPKLSEKEQRYSRDHTEQDLLNDRYPALLPSKAECRSPYGERKSKSTSDGIPIDDYLKPHAGKPFATSPTKFTPPNQYTSQSDNKPKSMYLKSTSPSPYHPVSKYVTHARAESFFSHPSHTPSRTYSSNFFHPSSPESLPKTTKTSSHCRPEATDIVARRIIAGALGVSIPKREDARSLEIARELQAKRGKSRIAKEKRYYPSTKEGGRN